MPPSLLQRVQTARAGRGLLLELDLTEELPDRVPTDPVARLQARRRTPLRTVVERLTRAATDDRVRGLVAKVGGPRVDLARAQELAEAVRAFRRTGKPAVAHAETFGELTGGTPSYLLATAFDEVWLQPSGDVGLTGVAAEAVFLRGALDRLGVEPQFGQRHEYKNAVDSLQRRELSPAHREALTGVVQSAFAQVVEGVAAGRGLPVETVRELVDRAPLLAEEARDAGLVDHVGYRDQAYAAARARIPEEVDLLLVGRYAPRPPGGAAAALVRRVTPGTRRRAVALVTATGTITQGRSVRPLLGQPTAGSDTVAAALRAAGRDEQVAAVVLRVDSGGGSYVASDTIWREVLRLREGGTPVVVSMGRYAASGGYFIAAPADAIVALPGTLTGSIGVFAGKAVTARLLDRLGVAVEGVAEGAQARMFAPSQPFTASERARLEGWLDRVYADFVDRVAQGRRLSHDEVHEVARGRVWTGADARERGLVDELGGLGAALALARRRAGLPDDAGVRVLPPTSPLAQLRPPRNTEDPAAAGAAGTGLEALAARLAGAAGAGGVLAVPEWRLR